MYHELHTVRLTNLIVMTLGRSQLQAQRSQGLFVLVQLSPQHHREESYCCSAHVLG